MERKDLMNKNNFIHYSFLYEQYYVSIGKVPKGDELELCVEFESKELVDYFLFGVCGYVGCFGPSMTHKFRREGNKVYLLGHDGHLLRCGRNEKLAQNLVEDLTEQYEEYKANKQNSVGK